MIGITACGAYIPRYRMKRKTIYDAVGWFNQATAGLATGEKAVANYDEDSITMAVSAAKDCLAGQDTTRIGGFAFSSTTAPYAERLNAAICAAALQLPPQTRTADYSASLRAGTTALVSALEAVQAGMPSYLVCASDCRQGKPGSNLEHICGDGAASFLVGREDVIAELKGVYHLTEDFPDYTRLHDNRFVGNWEERWIRDEGMGRIIPNAVNGFLDTCHRSISEFDKIIIASPMNAALKGICSKLAIPPEKLQDPLISTVGHSGSAHALMMLAAALETAKPGDRILVVSYGSGCDVLAFKATAHIVKARDSLGVSGYTAHKKRLQNYNKYLVYRDLIPLDIGIRGEETPPVRFSVMHRQGDCLSALVGSKCLACNTPQYPKQRVCVNPECGCVDQMADYPFADKTGKIKTFTGDSLAFTIDPPAVYGLIDFEDGGRLYLDIADSDLGTLQVGTPVKMAYRRRYADKKRGVYAYFWKACTVPGNC